MTGDSLADPDMTSANAAEAWQRLKPLAATFQSGANTLRGLFGADAARQQKFSISLPRLYFDYSKHLVDAATLGLLLSLARERDLLGAINALFQGAPVNNTEQRPALHMALRGHGLTGPAQQVTEVLERMDAFVTAVHTGTWRGYTGRPIRDVVNIGIGGSHLGPAMAMRALTPYRHSAINVHFLSNVDPSGGRELLARLDAATTLCIVASKSFTTLETDQNARMARSWLLDAGAGEADLAQHFVAVSVNVQAAVRFGIAAENVFPMWDWVGGRYSLWSAIGLPIALGLGMTHFRNLLAGAHQADEHFRTAGLDQNIPVIMGLLCAWYSGGFGAESQAVIPYSQHLELFPAFLQQLCMESLGKSVDLQGRQVPGHTGMIVWGAAGTDGQHSFHQLFHQGTRLVPVDFIAFANSPYPGDNERHNHLLANCFAQSQALMDGKSADQALQELLDAGMDRRQAEQLAPHKAVPGNRPSSTFLLDRLDPFNLGLLAALYEHSVYVQSVLWNINAFDQWGVELGKKLSGPLFAALESQSSAPSFDASTNALVLRARAWREY